MASMASMASMAELRSLQDARPVAAASLGQVYRGRWWMASGQVPDANHGAGGLTNQVALKITKFM